MTLRDRVRDFWVWLGLATEDSLHAQHKEVMAAIEQLPNRALFAASEQAQRNRHLELLESIKNRQEELLGAINGIRLLFQEQHLQKRSAPVVPYDWEGVQLQELAEMLANPPKDEN